MTTPFAHGEILVQPERECDCPPWIKRCVHREGAEEILVLAHGDTLYELHPPQRQDWRVGGYSHAVYFVSAQVALACNCGCKTRYAAGLGTMPRSRHHSEADALAAFYAAEEALLRGDA